MKTCNVCKIEKPKSEFYFQPTNKDKLRHDCKECANKKRKDYDKREEFCLEVLKREEG